MENLAKQPVRCIRITHGRGRKQRQRTVYKGLAAQGNVPRYVRNTVTTE